MRFSKIGTLCSYFFFCHTITAFPGTPPPRKNYTVTRNDIVCVALTAGFQLTVPYTGDTKNYTTTVTVPSDSYINGSCGVDSNTLNLYFNESWSLSFTFTNTTESLYQMDKIKLNYILDKAWFPNVSSSSEDTNCSHTTKLPTGTNKASTGGSYKCQGRTNLRLNGSITLSIYDLQYRAFGNTNYSWFSSSDEQKCMLSIPDPEVNTAVAMSVGIALGVMVVLVVLLYVIFTKAKGHKYGYT